MMLCRWKSNLLILSSMLLLAACDDGNTQQKADVQLAASEQSTPSAQVYRVVTENTKPPLINYVSGKPTGFEYDVLQAIADREGISLEYSVVPRVQLLSSVQEDKADIAAGAITITEERAKQVDFTDPVLDYTTAVLVTKDLSGVKSFAELRGKQVASRRGTVYEQMAMNELSNANGDNIHYYDSAWLQVKSVLNGRDEVVLGDSHILKYYVQQYDNGKVAFVTGIHFPTEHYGFALKKGNSELKQILNNGLIAIKADGTYDKIRQKYWQK